MRKKVPDVGVWALLLLSRNQGRRYEDVGGTLVPLPTSSQAFIQGTFYTEEVGEICNLQINEPKIASERSSKWHEWQP